MTLRGRHLVFFFRLQAIPSVTADVHSGGLDENGCRRHRQTDDHHCRRSPGENPDDAPVKKSRAGICHDRTSPN